MGGWGGDRKLEQHLHDQGLEPCEQEPTFLVPLPRGAGVCNESEAVLTQGDDMWTLELNLPPHNMLRVLTFISRLGPEPEEDGNGHRCGVDSPEAWQHWAWVEQPAEVPMDIVPKGMRLVTRDSVGVVVGRTSVGPFPTEEGAQDWLDKRNGVTRMKGP